MRVWGSVLGGYARSRFVRRVLRDFERGLVAFGDLERSIVEASSVIIGAQVSAGLAYVVDGLLDWHDIFRSFVSSWRNVTPTGLLRYFDNNFFYRIPLFTGEPEAIRLVWPPRVKLYSRLSEPSGFKVVIPGPFTFTSMSINASKASFGELASSIARLLESEVRGAVESGASMIQIDEPILSDPDIKKDDAIMAVELINSIIRDIKGVKTILSVYFDVPSSSVYEVLLNSRVDCLSLDIIDAPKRALDLILGRGFGGHCGVLGLINARTIYDDDISRLEDIFGSIIKGYSGEEIGLTTSTWLDLIPYDYSLRKTKLLGLLVERIARSFNLEHVWRVS
ncbi:MAG: methylcobalamin--homocysteine methyltransferase [Acidilobaceae archaeon]